MGVDYYVDEQNILGMRKDFVGLWTAAETLSCLCVHVACT